MIDFIDSDIVFDYERAYNIMLECADIFDNESFFVNQIYKNNVPYLEIQYNNVILNFSCYKYC